MRRQLKSDDQSKHDCIVDHGEIKHGTGTSNIETRKGEGWGELYAVCKLVLRAVRLLGNTHVNQRCYVAKHQNLLLIWTAGVAASAASFVCSSGITGSCLCIPLCRRWCTVSRLQSGMHRQLPVMPEEHPKLAAEAATPAVQISSKL